MTAFATCGFYSLLLLCQPAARSQGRQEARRQIRLYHTHLPEHTHYTAPDGLLSCHGLTYSRPLTVVIRNPFGFSLLMYHTLVNCFRENTLDSQLWWFRKCWRITYCSGNKIKLVWLWYLQMVPIISCPTSSSLYQQHQNTLLSLGLSHCPTAVSNHFAFPIITQREGR